MSAEETQESRFNRLAQQWTQETVFLSNPSSIMKNKAFQEIVDMGEDALPFLFDKLQDDEDGLWWMPLERITHVRLTEGVTPIEGVPGWAKTDVSALKAAWLAWGREKGYASKP